MLSATKYFLPSPNSNYIIAENEDTKEAIFVIRVYLYKNASMLSPEELYNYFSSISSILKNTQIPFNTVLSTKESSAVDYVENIKNLLSLAEKTEEEAKKLILLSQVDLILRKIGEHKNYFHIYFSEKYTDDAAMELFSKQKIESFLRWVQKTHSFYPLEWSDLVQYFSEYYLTKPTNKIYITDANINKVFEKK